MEWYFEKDACVCVRRNPRVYTKLGHYLLVFIVHLLNEQLSMSYFNKQKALNKYFNQVKILKSLSFILRSKGLLQMQRVLMIKAQLTLAWLKKFFYQSCQYRTIPATTKSNTYIWQSIVLLLKQRVNGIFQNCELNKMIKKASGAYFFSVKTIPTFPLTIKAVLSKRHIFTQLHLNPTCVMDN